MYLGGLIPSYSVIVINDHEITSEHTKYLCKKFMMNVESKMGNSKRALFDGTKSDAIHLSAFDDERDVDDNVLLYGEEIIYHK